MNKVTFAIVAVSLALPLAAQAQTRLTEAQLVQSATSRGICKDLAVVSARYVNETENRVAVTCGSDAEGFVPLAAAGLGLGGAGVAAAAVAGLGLAAAAAGGGGSTPDTQ